jgi:hypothetical protein
MQFAVGSKAQIEFHASKSDTDALKVLHGLLAIDLQSHKATTDNLHSMSKVLFDLTRNEWDGLLISHCIALHCRGWMVLNESKS